MQCPIRTPAQVAEHLANLRATHGQMLGAYESRRTLLEHELAEQRRLREAHARGEQFLSASGKPRPALHITDVIRRQFALEGELRELQTSHLADLTELTRSLVQGERLERCYRDGLDTLRLQEAEAVLELTGDVGSAAGRELLDSVILDLALHADTPAAVELAQQRVGVWDGCRSEHPYHAEVGSDWELLLGLAPDYRVDGPREVPALPLDACIYYLTLLRRGKIQTLERALAEGLPALYEDPFQDE